MRVVAAASLFVADPPEAFARRLRETLTRTVRRRGRGGLSRPEEVCLVEVVRGGVVVPRGAVGLVTSTAADLGIEVSWVSGVSRPEGAPCRIDDLGVTLRPYQREAVEACHRLVQCLVDLPCGGGKTTIGAAAIVSLGVPALVMVPSRDLVDQWVDRLRATGAADVRPRGRRGSRPLGPGSVMVAIPSAFEDAGALGSVGVLVVDECHRAPARTWAEVVARCPARYRWGLTATPERSDGLGWTLPHLFGRVVVPATSDELIRDGYLQRPTIVPVSTGWAPDPAVHYPIPLRCPACGRRVSAMPASVDLGEVVCAGRVPSPDPGRGAQRCGRGYTRGDVDPDPEDDRRPIAYSAALSDLAGDPARLELAARIARACVGAGRCVMVLLPTVRAVEAVEGALCRQGVAAAALTGREPKGARREVVAAVRAGKVRALIATRVADEGLDLPDLDAMVLAEPGRARGRALQRAGRAARPGGAPPLVFDLVDGGDEFHRQWRSRRAGYAAEYGVECLGAPDPVSAEEAIAFLRPGG